MPKSLPKVRDQGEGLASKIDLKEGWGTHCLHEMLYYSLQEAFHNHEGLDTVGELY